MFIVYQFRNVASEMLSKSRRLANYYQKVSKYGSSKEFYYIHKTKPPATFGISFAYNGWLVKFGIYIDKQ